MAYQINNRRMGHGGEACFPRSARFTHETQQTNTHTAWRKNRFASPSRRDADWQNSWRQSWRQKFGASKVRTMCQRFSFFLMKFFLKWHWMIFFLHVLNPRQSMLSGFHSKEVYQTKDYDLKCSCCEGSQKFESNSVFQEHWQSLVFHSFWDQFHYFFAICHTRAAWTQE